MFATKFSLICLHLIYMSFDCYTILLKTVRTFPSLIKVMKNIKKTSKHTNMATTTLIALLGLKCEVNCNP